MKHIVLYLSLLSTLLFPLSISGKTTAKESADLARWKANTERYLAKVSADSTWLFSRLQMYWNTHATDVFVNSERFDHAGGDRAPVPTVKYNGTRSTESAYNRPKLDDVIPYDNDAQSNVTYINKATGKMEKAHPSKTGCNINSLNQQILGIARDASRIYKATGDRRYAALAYPVFDTYLKGIYYRNVPTDLTHGHMQTLVGMATFEVIHEDAVASITEIYANLGKYITRDRDLYEAAMKKWAENIIANGVPHNNGDLCQAEFITDIALVLRSNKDYADHKGREYYLNYIQNTSSIRQWSMGRLINFGYDPQTAIWYESPGYSTTVSRDFTEPETQAQQQRTNIVVKTSKSGGFYVDIFRSRLPKGQELMEPEFHDYFYHNLGQQMRLTDTEGQDFNLQPTEELAFAGGHISAYSYLYNKKTVTTDKDAKATFDVLLTGKDIDDVKAHNGSRITMTMWMEGAPQRELFTALSPVNLEYERMKGQPYDIGHQPVLTFVACQHGEAWNRPFVAVFEPSSEKEPSEIQSVQFFHPANADVSAVGIKVVLKDGSTKVITADDKGNVEIK